MKAKQQPLFPTEKPIWIVCRVTNCRETFQGITTARQDYQVGTPSVLANIGWREIKADPCLSDEDMGHHWDATGVCPACAGRGKK